jgi:hypothetical protein
MSQFTYITIDVYLTNGVRLAAISGFGIIHCRLIKHYTMKNMGEWQYGPSMRNVNNRKDGLSDKIWQADSSYPHYRLSSRR